MAAQKENLLSLGNLTDTRNNFTKQREHGLKKRPVLLQADFSTPQSRHQAVQLQQRWQELKERELKAQQHNRQLLQQFEEAQDSLGEMLTLTATMKAIRMEYDRYLKENSPRWRQQLQEQTQAAQKKRMEEYLKSCLKNTAGETKHSSDRPLHSHDATTETQNIDAPKHHNNNNHLNPNQDGSPHLPYMQPFLQAHPQSMTARFPIRAPYQHQPSTYVPHSFLPHLASSPGHYPPGWGSSQPNYPWSWAAGEGGLPSDFEALWGQPYMTEPRPMREAHVTREEAETSRSSSSQRGGGDGSGRSHLSQELDVKPVRLSESSKGSSQGSGERRKKKREKRGRSQHSSSDRDRHSSAESSRSSTAIISAAAPVAQSSESDASSEKGRSRTKRRSSGLTVGSPRAEKEVKERSRREGDDSGSHKEESQSESEELESPIEESMSEKAENPESGSQREEESGSVSIKYEGGSGNKIEEESGNSKQSSVQEKDEEEGERENDLEDGDEEDEVEEKERSQTDKEQEEMDQEDVDEASDGKSTTEEEDETGAEEEMEEQESEDGDEVSRNLDSASSQEEEVGEDESKGGDREIEEGLESEDEEKEEGGEGEEQRRDEAGDPEEEGDSDDCIIAPQENRTKKIYVIPEATEDDEAEEEDEGSKNDSSDHSNEFSDEDIEHLLAPKEPQIKEEKETSTDEKPRAHCDKVEIFQVEQYRPTKTDHQSDSDEFDHFYD